MTVLLHAASSAAAVRVATFVRLGWVIVGMLQSGRRRHTGEEGICIRTCVQWRNIFESSLLPATAPALAIFYGAEDATSLIRVVGLVIGGALALRALALLFWAVRVFPCIAAERFVSEGQGVPDGPYAYVRPPHHCGMFLRWRAVVLAFPSRFVLFILAGDVTPSCTLLASIGYVPLSSRR